jgi:murein L,D-transpeptidase YcbB/YkuD
MKNFRDLKRFAEAQKFFVTSITGGKHNRASKHALGLAIDVRTRDKTNEQIGLFVHKCAALGVRVRDERKRPTGQKVWSAPHLHLEITSETLSKVIEFQKQHGLVVDGIVGRKTLAVLDSVIK